MPPDAVDELWQPLQFFSIIRATASAYPNLGLSQPDAFILQSVFNAPSNIHLFINSTSLSSRRGLGLGGILSSSLSSVIFSYNSQSSGSKGLNFLLMIDS